MKRFFQTLGKKHKKAPKPPQQPISPGKSSNVAAGSPGSRADQEDDISGTSNCYSVVDPPDPTAKTDNGNTGTSSQIAIQDEASEFQVSNLGIDGTGSEHEFAILCKIGGIWDPGVKENDSAVPSEVSEDEDPALGSASGGADKAVEERFGPLKSALGAIPAAYANDEGAVVVGNRVENLLSRVVELEEDFDSCPHDVAEQRRRSKLRDDFEDVKQQLQSLIEMPEFPKERAFGLLEGLQDIIFNYQVCSYPESHRRYREADDKRLHEMDPADVTALNNFFSAQRAEYRHGNRIGCLKGTRGTVLDEIGLWTRDFDKPPVYWLNGLAGTGKTTIAQTIAERTFADGKLGASFFCSRDFEDRRDLHFIFPTIAVQLARKYPEFRSLFVPLVQSDPGIAHESLYDQLHRLIVKPLRESAISTVVVIDALDECKDEEPASAILSVLGQLVSEIPKVKFLITGRPEPRIREGFRLPLLADAADVSILHDVEPSQVYSDIRLFFRHKFSELARRRPGLNDWPTEEQLHVLCERAAGLFIYAAATVKFIDKQSGNPRKQLDLLLQSPESSVREAKTKFKENTTLDSLYTSILLGAFGDDDDSDNDPKVRSVLGAMVLAANPLSPSTIALLLGFDTEDVFPLLSSAQSLLIVQEDVHYPVRPFHKSFPDFITDPDRCTNQRFHVSPPSHHSQLLIRSLDLMDRMLDKNMCKLPDLVANSDVSDLKERIERYIDPALQYACRSWHTHLVVGRDSTPLRTLKITSALHRFLEKKLLFWLEVLSVLGAVRNAVEALQVAVDWLEESPTLDLATDGSRFVSGYFEIINASSPHIYHSALPSTPRTSMIWKLYESHVRPFTKVVYGVPSSWDLTVAVKTLPETITSVTWSSSGKFIAFAQDKPMSPPENTRLAVDILDSATLHRLQSLRVSTPQLEFSGALIFSPDGSMLSSASHNRRSGFVSTWDLQTGGLASRVAVPNGDWWKLVIVSITYSMNGKMVGTLHLDGVTATISVVDIVSGVYTHNIHPCTPWTHNIWTHGESLRFATTEGTAITIWEVEFTQGAAQREIETLPIPDDADQARAFDQKVPQHVRRAQFFPIPCKFAITRASPGSADELLVWDPRNSAPQLHETRASWYPGMSFSSDGRFFACSTTGLEVCLWKESSTGYTLIGKLQSNAQRSIPLLSPNGESIITFGDHTVQLWHTKDFTTHSSILAPVPHFAEHFILEFVPDKKLAVVARPEEKTVAIIDLESGLPQLTIDASMDVYGFRVVENTVIVIGDGRIITWNLPEGNSLPHTRVGLENSTRMTYFSDESQDDTIASPAFPDPHHIAFPQRNPRDHDSKTLHIYCSLTGRLIFTFRYVSATSSLFHFGKNEISYPAGSGLLGKYGFTEAGLGEYFAFAGTPASPGPWKSHGFEVTEDGWVICPDGKRLFMLPPPWRSKGNQRIWHGQFLALLHATLPQPIILDLAP